ncbi:MAG: response regulator [Chitinispirillaceae bacterium]|nr:response regulator [Chitinispirillaceae bacterium]
MIIEDRHTGSKGKILVADDDMFYRRLLANFLTGEKYSVTSVHSSDEARNHLLRENFDMCVFDYNLPGGPLETVIAFMNRSARPVPFIIITGDESCDTEREARTLGPVFYFVKPFSLSDFVSVIRESIARTPLPVPAPEKWSLHHE